MRSSASASSPATSALVERERSGTRIRASPSTEAMDLDDRKKSTSEASATPFPLLMLLLALASAFVLIGMNSSVHKPHPYNLASLLLWKNASVRPPVMLVLVVAGWAWVVRSCRQRGMHIALVLGGKLQPAASTYQAALTLLNMVLACRLLHLFIAEEAEHPRAARPWLSCNLALLVCIVVLGALPLRTFYADSRFSLLRTLVESVVAPCAPVTFWHVIVADYLTSLAKTMSDLHLTACISGELMRGAQGDAELVRTSELWNLHYQTCNRSPVNAVMLALPFWWRLMQCLKVYSVTREQKNLWNALKYSTAFPLVYAGYLRKHDSSGAYDVLFVLAAVVQSSFTFVWDVLMDWGLPRRDSAAPCGVGMREVLLVTPRKSSYLLLCAFNLVLRFVWTLSFLNWVPGRGGGMFFLELAEVARRTVWAVFRIEWEMVAKGHTRTLAAGSDDDLESEEMQLLGGGGGELRSAIDD